MTIRAFNWTLLLFAGVLFLGSAQPIFAQTKADDMTGYWHTRDQKSVVWIYLAKNGKYYGKIIHLKDPLDSSGKPKVDKYNPDESKRQDPVKGLLILRGFEFKGGSWEDGKIYDPESGKDYSCNIKMEGKDVLKVRGYVGISALGRTETWHRTTKPD